MKDDGGNAFPIGASDLGPAENIRDGGFGGMSKRLWLAGMAMQGMYMNIEFNTSPIEHIAECAFKTADLMLEQEKKG